MKIICTARKESGVIVRTYETLRERKCKVCGKLFQPKTRISFACPGKCRNTLYYRNNPKKFKYAHVVLKNRICKICGNEFEPKRSNSLYCSKKCGRKAYHKNRLVEDNRDSREYNKTHKEQIKNKRKLYKDKIRHDGEREKLINEYGFVCSRCGKKKDSFDIVAHHTSFDNTKHENQILLCRSCHRKVHWREETKLSFKKVCESCGKQFYAKTKKAQYCSRKCFPSTINKKVSEETKERQRKWALENQDKVKVYKRKYYLNNIEECNERSRLHYTKKFKTGVLK